MNPTKGERTMEMTKIELTDHLRPNRTRAEHHDFAAELFYDIRWDLPADVSRQMRDMLDQARELDGEEMLRRSRPVIVKALVSVSLMLSERVIELMGTSIGSINADDEVVDARAYARFADRLRQIDEALVAAAAAEAAADVTEDEDDCRACGGSGGGTEPGLRCPMCCGTGVRP